MTWIPVALPDTDDEITVSVVGEDGAIAATPMPALSLTVQFRISSLTVWPELAAPADIPTPPALKVLVRITPNAVPCTSAPMALRSNIARSMSSVSVPLVVSVASPIALSRNAESRMKRLAVAAPIAAFTPTRHLR